MKQAYFLDDPRIRPYEFNGLRGRYAHWPAASAGAKRTFVLVYGQHATIERLLPIVETLTAYGDVYGPDNPGFGGMDSPYKIGRKPNLPLYAEHLNHFIDKYIPTERQLTLFGISYGFQMLVQLLHDNPELQARTEQVISLVGFVSYKDFHMPKTMSLPLLYIGANSGRTRAGALFYDWLLKSSVITSIYRLTKPIQAKFKTLSGEEAKRYAREQAWLWIVNDNRTHATTAWDFFRHNDLTGYRLKTEVIHLGVPNDHLISNPQIEAELRGMFSKVTTLRLNLANHAPVDIETPAQVHALLPSDLKKKLADSCNQEAIK